MENSKIYVVLDVNKFKELCEEKIGKSITPEDFIDMETFINEKVHLVPNKEKDDLLHQYYIKETPKYNILIETKQGWKLKNIVEIIESDIRKLKENDAIIELNEFKIWKDQFAFKVIDIKQFIKQISEKVTDEELISILSMRNMNVNNFEMFIKENKDKFSILYKDGKINILRELPYSKLSKKDILDLIKDDLIENCKCKFNYENNCIKFEDKTFLIGPTAKLRGISVIQSPNGSYIARGNIERKEKKGFHDWRMIHVAEETEDKAISKLKEILLGNLHQDINKTLRHYMDSINDKDINI